MNIMVAMMDVRNAIFRIGGALIANISPRRFTGRRTDNK